MKSKRRRRAESRRSPGQLSLAVPSQRGIIGDPFNFAISLEYNEGGFKTNAMQYVLQPPNQILDDLCILDLRDGKAFFARIFN